MRIISKLSALSIALILLSGCEQENAIPKNWTYIQVYTNQERKIGNIPNLEIPVPSGTTSGPNPAGILIGPEPDFFIFYSLNLGHPDLPCSISNKELIHSGKDIQLAKVNFQCVNNSNIQASYSLSINGYEFIAVPKSGANKNDLQQIQTSLLNAKISN